MCGPDSPGGLRCHPSGHMNVHQHAPRAIRPGRVRFGFTVFRNRPAHREILLVAANGAASRSRKKHGLVIEDPYPHPSRSATSDNEARTHWPAMVYTPQFSLVGAHHLPCVGCCRRGTSSTALDPGGRRSVEVQAAAWQDEVMWLFYRTAGVATRAARHRAVAEPVASFREQLAFSLGWFQLLKRLGQEARVERASASTTWRVQAKSHTAANSVHASLSWFGNVKPRFLSRIRAGGCK